MKGPAAPPPPQELLQELVSLRRRIAESEQARGQAEAIHRRTIKELAREEARLRSLVETLPDVIWLKDLKGVYLDAIELLSAVQWPFLIFVAIMARSIILIWLGQNWLEIVPLVRVLCIANLALFAACLSYPVLVAVGHVRDALVSSFISLPPSLVVILFAALFGVQAAAASALVTLPFQAAVAFYFIGRHLGIGPGDLARTFLKSGVVTATTASGVLGCAALIEVGMVTPFVGLISAFCSATVCWWFGLALTKHPLLHQLYRAAGGLAVIAPRLRPSRPVAVKLAMPGVIKKVEIRNAHNEGRSDRP